MKKIIATSLLMAAGITMNAHAGYISGSHTLTNGKTVALQGLEWMPLTHTAGLSRIDIEDGFTDRFGKTWEAGAWTYATRAQTETLLSSLWDQTYSGWSNGNASGVQWFISNFGGLAYDQNYGNTRIDGKINNANYKNLDYTSFIFGAATECHVRTDLTCLTFMQFVENSTYSFKSINVKSGDLEVGYASNTGAAGLLDAWYGLKGVSNFGFAQFKTNEAYKETGSLLVRQTTVTPPVTVNAPTSLSVLAIGLLSLLLRRRRTTQQ